MWFVKMGGGINGRCMVCMQDRVESHTRYVMADDRTIG